MRYLITGGCGFLGSNLASEVIKRGDELFILDNLYRLGTEKNLEWLKTLGDFKFYRNDVRNTDDVNFVISEVKPDVVFHVAGQVAMTTSLERPRFDFEINVLGSFNILEALKKHAPNAILLYSSTNKVYGDLERFTYQENKKRYVVEEFFEGFPETIPLDFRTPYGCSKGAADQYIKDAYKCFDLKTIVFRHSSIYGGRQFSTFDQGWIGWFISQANDIKSGRLKDKFTISGDGKQVRDVLFSSDLTNCYFEALSNIDKTKGQVFNIGGGKDNSLSLLELFDILEKELDIKMEYSSFPFRTSDQLVFIADINKAKKYYGWEPKIDKIAGIRQMIKWVNKIKE